MDLTLWFAFLVASLLISISPGAGAVNTMSNGLQNGVKNTLPSIFGLQLGYGIQIIIVGVGLGQLLATSNLAFEVIKWLGAAYLMWLGYKKWTQKPLDMATVKTIKYSKKKLFWMAAFVNITNPKAVIFLLALFPQFIDVHSETQTTQYVVMGITLILADITVMIGYASLAAQLSRWMNSQKYQVTQNRIFGSMYVAVATAMASYRSS